MMRLLSIGCAAAALLLTGPLPPALAQSAAPPSDALRGACSADFKKLCGKVTPGAGRITTCMKEREAELSPTCREAMNSAEGRQQQGRY
jgi:hypothetical protein